MENKERNQSLDDELFDEWKSKYDVVTNKLMEKLSQSCYDWVMKHPELTNQHIDFAKEEINRMADPKERLSYNADAEVKIQEDLDPAVVENKPEEVDYKAFVEEHPDEVEALKAGEGAEADADLEDAVKLMDDTTDHQKGMVDTILECSGINLGDIGDKEK